MSAPRVQRNRTAGTAQARAATGSPSHPRRRAADALRRSNHLDDRDCRTRDRDYSFERALLRTRRNNSLLGRDCLPIAAARRVIGRPLLSICNCDCAWRSAAPIAVSRAAVARRNRAACGGLAPSFAACALRLRGCLPPPIAKALLVSATPGAARRTPKTVAASVPRIFCVGEALCSARTERAIVLLVA